MEKQVILGKGNPSGQNVAIGASARARSTYVIGITGTGKSTLLESMAYQDIANRDGLCFLDPHGDSVKKLMASIPDYRESDVIFWDPSDIDRPFGFNPFFCSDPTNELEVSRKTQSFIDALGSLKEFAPIFESGAARMKNMLQQLATTFIINQGHTLAETPKFLLDQEYREQFYPALSNRFARIRRYWEEELDARSERERREISESSLNKLERFQSDPVLHSIFGQPTNSIDFRQAMDRGVIILVNLGADRGGIIGAFVVWELLQAAFSRADISNHERRPFHLFADEFQTYMTTAFPMLQAQARKYGVDTVIAHQVRAQLTPEIAEITPAVGNLIIFRVTGHNATSLANEFDTTPPPGELRPEMITSPVYKESYEWIWDSEDEKKEFNTIDREYFRLNIEMRVLYEVFKPLLACYEIGSFANLFAGKTRDQEYMKLVEKYRDCEFTSSIATGFYFHTNREQSVPFPSSQKFWWTPEDVEQDFYKCLDEIEQNWQEWLSGKYDEIIKDILILKTEGSKPTHPAQRDYGAHSRLPRWYSDPIFPKEERQTIIKTLADEFHSNPTVSDKYVWVRTKTANILEQQGKITPQRQERLAKAQKLKKEYQGYDLPVKSGDIQQYRWVPGTQKTPDQVAAETANQLVGLANFQARCKLTQENARPKEHLILTYDFPGIENEALGQQLRQRSRVQYGRDRGEVEHAIEERLQIRQAMQEEPDEPILREKSQDNAHAKKRNRPPRV